MNLPKRRRPISVGEDIILFIMEVEVDGVLRRSRRVEIYESIVVDGCHGVGSLDALLLGQRCRKLGWWRRRRNLSIIFLFDISTWH